MATPFSVKRTCHRQASLTPWLCQASLSLIGLVSIGPASIRSVQRRRTPGAGAVAGDDTVRAGRIQAAADGLAVPTDQLGGALEGGHCGRKPRARLGLGLPVAGGIGASRAAVAE